MKPTTRNVRRAVTSNAATLRQAQAVVDRYGPAFPRTPTSATTKVEAYLQSVPITRVRSSYAIKHAARIAAKARAKADAEAFLAKHAAYGGGLAVAADGLERTRKIQRTLRLRPDGLEDRPDGIELFVLQHLRTYLQGPPAWQFLTDTVNIVLDYLEGKRVLDGNCSDVQCHIAIEAAKHYGMQV